MTDLLARMGINTEDLGCVMLDVEPLTELHDAIPSSLWYVNPEKSWASGPTLDAHVTLLFGLMKSAHVWREFVDEALEGWTPPPVVDICGLAVFGRDSDPYDCIVGEVHRKSGFALREANRRLKKLPHVDTFGDYRAHVTVGYVLKGTARLVMPDLTAIIKASHARAYTDVVLQTATGSINYGDEVTA